MPNPTKGDLAQELAETKQKLADLEALQSGAGAAVTAGTTADTMMKQFMTMMKAQQEAAEAQVRAQREAAEAQQKAAEDDRKVLLNQMNKQASQIDALMKELVDTKRRNATENSSRGPKPVAPAKLLPEMSVSKFKAWRKAWDDYAHMCRVDKMQLEEQQALFRTTLSLEMRDVLEERIGVDPQHGPEKILDEIEKFIRKKRSVVLDMVEFDRRTQHTDENFDAYLVAVQQLAADADLTHGHCNECKVKCLDRRLAGRLISGIRDEKTRTKLLEEEKFPSRDKVVEICCARESAQQNNREKWGQQQSGVHAVKTYPNKKGHSKSQDQEPQEECKCSRCGRNEHKSMNDCPARGEKCNFCKQVGHFSRCCRKKQQQEATEKSEGQGGLKFGRITKIDTVGTHSPAFTIRSVRTRALGEKAIDHDDTKATDPPELQVGQPVQVQDHVSKLWDINGVVIKVGSKRRSYLVKVSEHQYMWRNRKFVRTDPGGQVVPLDWLPSTPPSMKSTRGAEEAWGEKKSHLNPEVEESPTSSSSRT